ncbi:MAG: class I SAM-dependent methyltransferase [Bacteroidales bacterium]|nr:class I SAM-dependent methyltransferase [Bacteroidales bacterium]
MKRTAIKYGYLAVFLSVIALTSINAQNKSGNEFVPEVGQQGKDVVWVPTPQELVDKMLEIAGVTANDYVIDLGSGDGRTVITAAKLGANALGVEYNPDMVALSRRNAQKEGVADKAKFIEADLFETDLSKATVITMFLLPEINLRLRPKLLELKPGTRIVSNTFTMGEWEADYEVTTEDNWNSWNHALMWIVPAKVEGKWKLDKGELNITQNYQFISGTLTINGKNSPLTDGRLKGSEITFTIDGAVYTGKVDGSKMSGTFVSGSTKGNWSASKIN